MIRRFYVHNFRCLENFELPISGLSSVLLIGKNGSGKTTTALALEILQRIGRGTNRVGDLVKPKDFARGRSDVPMRFEIEVVLDAKVYAYTLAFELPKLGKELRVLEEKLESDGEAVYIREGAHVRLVSLQNEFPLDQNLVALPIIQARWMKDPLFFFKRLMARMKILGPIPSLIQGESTDETLWPNLQVTNLGAWFSGLLGQTPAAYSRIDEFLKQMMPDLKDIQNPEVGVGARSLVVQFSNQQGSVTLPFGDLSDGEKCFMVCAMVLAGNDGFPSVCFWDEPDNYLALDEVQHFVMALRRAFQSSGGQLIATSHNPEAIRAFSRENTLLLHRRSHLEPTLVRKLSEVNVHGDLVGALIRGDVEPDGRQQG